MRLKLHGGMKHGLGLKEFAGYGRWNGVIQPRSEAPAVVSLDWLEDRGWEVLCDHSAREFGHIANLDGAIDAYQQMNTP